MGEIKNWNKPVITCCASGMRNASAAGILKSNGVEVMNGVGLVQLEPETLISFSMLIPQDESIKLKYLND